MLKLCRKKKKNNVTTFWHIAVRYLCWCTVKLFCHLSRKGTLKKHVPNCGKEGNKELEKIAASFEELIFNNAIDQVPPSTDCKPMNLVIVWSPVNLDIKTTFGLIFCLSRVSGGLSSQNILQDHTLKPPKFRHDINMEGFI